MPFNYSTKSKTASAFYPVRNNIRRSAARITVLGNFSEDLNTTPEFLTGFMAGSRLMY